MNVLDPPGKRRRPQLATVGFFCALVTLIASLAWTVATRQTISRQVQHLKRELSTLQRQSRELESLHQQSGQDQDALLRAFRHFRRAEDIPALGGSRIVSNQIDQDSVIFYVPAGNHTLNVKASWNPGVAGQASGAPNAKTKPGSEKSGPSEQIWSIPLIAEQGYRFNLTRSSRQQGAFGWELNSNTQEFEPVSDTVASLPPIRTSGTSWSSFRIASFPNQPELRFLINPDHPANPSRDFKHPIRIGKWTKSGQLDGGRLQVTFELTLSSDTPAVVAASDAEALAILKRDDLLQDYLGDGRYLLKTE